MKFEVIDTEAIEAGLRVDGKLTKKDLEQRCATLEAELARCYRMQGKLTSELSRMCGCAYDLGQQLYALVDAFDACDRCALDAQLAAMSGRRKQFGSNRPHAPRESAGHEPAVPGWAAVTGGLA